MALFDAFKALEEIDDEVVIKSKVKKTPVTKTLKENVNSTVKKAPVKESIHLHEDRAYDAGQAYYFANTGDTVDYKGQKYTLITDRDGGHLIGHTDTLLLKNVATCEELEVAKKDFIGVATLLKEELNEASQDDYYVLSDGKDPRRSHVYSNDVNVEELIANLEKVKNDYGYWELLHYVNGAPKKIWSTEEGRIGESLIKEEPVVNLEPDYDARKSFYGKARVDEREDGSKVLWSYNTPVCKIADGKATLLKKGYLGWASSQTTLRHVKEFLKQNGFKAESMKQMAKDYPVEQYNESIEVEATKTKLTESETVSLNSEEEVKKGKEILNKEEGQQPEQIVDVDADTVDKLKDSYIGNTILQCPVCRTLIYKKPDALKKAEDSELYNVGEACPHCASEDGYELVGQVAPVDIPVEEPAQTTGTEEVKTEVETEVEEEPAPEEDEKRERRKLTAFEPEGAMGESLIVEDINTEKFDTLVTKYINNIYNNVNSYTTTSGTVEEDTGNIVVEGKIKYASGKESVVTFKFNEAKKTKGGKCKLVGLSEKFSAKENAFTFVGSLKEGVYTPETLAYNYTIKTLNESKEEVEKEVRGRVSTKKQKIKK